jgi:hypothetical protein
MVPEVVGAFYWNMITASERMKQDFLEFSNKAREHSAG